jgi:Rrf2 family cysteine metabolism transcriptional repressor
MMFSTKAEYGVRVMVELAHGDDGEPVPLAEIAARGDLPLAYLEHLVARLRKSGLVDSRRGSRGGYMLARSPLEITMAEIVEALEGSIAPIECISQGPDGSIVCTRESEPGHVCPTKLLWTRVRGAVVATLQETTLADLLLGPTLADRRVLSPMPGTSTASPTSTAPAKLSTLEPPPPRTRPLASGA